MQHVFPLKSLLSKHSFQNHSKSSFRLFGHSPHAESGHMPSICHPYATARKKLIEHPVIRWKLAEMTRQASCRKKWEEMGFSTQKSVGNQSKTWGTLGNTSNRL
jgi:hypothetical protein